MFIHSRAIGTKILNDFKKFTFIFSLATQCFYLFYLVYALAVSAGNLAANVILLVLSALYLAFYIASKAHPEILNNLSQRKTRHAYVISKLTVRAFTLALTLYGIHIAASHVSTLSVILAALTVMGWTLGVLFELVTFVFEKYFDLMMTAVKADVQPIVNVYNKITFKGSAPEKEPTKTEAYVKSLGEELKNELKTKKTVKKAEKNAIAKAKTAMRIEKIKAAFKRKNNEAPSDIETEEAEKR